MDDDGATQHEIRFVSEDEKLRLNQAEDAKKRRPAYYSRPPQDDDFMVPKSGYYFEHDDRGANGPRGGGRGRGRWRSGEPHRPTMAQGRDQREPARLGERDRMRAGGGGGSGGSSHDDRRGRGSGWEDRGAPEDSRRRDDNDVRGGGGPMGKPSKRRFEEAPPQERWRGRLAEGEGDTGRRSRQRPESREDYKGPDEREDIGRGDRRYHRQGPAPRGEEHHAGDRQRGPYLEDRPTRGERMGRQVPPRREWDIGKSETDQYPRAQSPPRRPGGPLHSDRDTYRGVAAREERLHVRARPRDWEQDGHLSSWTGQVNRSEGANRYSGRGGPPQGRPSSERPRERSRSPPRRSPDTHTLSGRRPAGPSAWDRHRGAQQVRQAEGGRGGRRAVSPAGGGKWGHDMFEIINASPEKAEAPAGGGGAGPN